MEKNAPKEKNQKDKTECEKCKQKSKIYNRNKFLCLDCFYEIINHKFRANLRTCCKIRHEDYVLICISGGNSSMTMLHMFWKSFTQNKSNKKLFFKLKVLYVDDSLFLTEKNLIEEEKNKRKIFIDSLCKKYNFEYEIISLENVMDLNNENLKLDNEVKLDLINEYLNLYGQLPNKGGFKTRFIQITTRNLIFFYSIKYNFSKIFFGNNGQSLVNDSFLSIIMGRGIDIRHDIDHLDDTYLNGKIQILKPCQDFFTKEIMYYFHYNKVEIIYPIIKDEKTNVIVNNFFTKLQSEKLNSIPSVINTIEKLNLYKNDYKCLFCLSNNDKGNSVMEFGLDSELNNKECQLNLKLCYGCRRMFSNLIEDNIKNKNNNSIIDKILKYFQPLISIN